MKSRVTSILSIGIALVAVAAVQAQDKTVTANVPFSFYMDSSLMPQGPYRVSTLSNGMAVWIMSMKSDATKAVTALRVIGKTRDEPARLVFHRYGEEYFLAEIWTGDSPSGGGLPRSPREKELAQSGAAPPLAMIQVSLHR
jgi:hypothetical protein